MSSLISSVMSSGSYRFENKFGKKFGKRFGYGFVDGFVDGFGISSVKIPGSYRFIKVRIGSERFGKVRIGSERGSERSSERFKKLINDTPGLQAALRLKGWDDHHRKFL